MNACFNHCTAFPQSLIPVFTIMKMYFINMNSADKTWLQIVKWHHLVVNSGWYNSLQHNSEGFHPVLLLHVLRYSRDLFSFIYLILISVFIAFLVSRCYYRQMIQQMFIIVPCSSSKFPTVGAVIFVQLRAA